MAVTSTASTEWHGSLFEGDGIAKLETSGAATLPVNWKARSEGSAATTTPEELLGAAHAACFSMALANMLGEAGYTPTSLVTTAAVTFAPDKGKIERSVLTVKADVPDISEDEFLKLASDAKAGCPVSQALAGIDISLETTLA